MFKSLSLVAGLLLVASPISANDGVNNPPEDDKVVCKRVQNTGWRLSKSSKVCKTRAEWRAISEETRKEFRDYGRTGSQGNLGE